MRTSLQLLARRESRTFDIVKLLLIVQKALHRLKFARLSVDDTTYKFYT